MIFRKLEPDDGIAYTAHPFQTIVTVLFKRFIALTDELTSVKGPPVAQLDRAPGFEPGCREFESLRAGQPT